MKNNMLSREDKAMQEASSYRVVRENGSARIEEKKSRFIADVFAVTTQQEAEEQINLITKRYWDARHHCYAYVLETNGRWYEIDGGQWFGYSDAREVLREFPGTYVATIELTADGFEVVREGFSPHK